MSCFLLFVRVCSSCSCLLAWVLNGVCLFEVVASWCFASFVVRSALSVVGVFGCCLLFVFVVCCWLCVMGCCLVSFVGARSLLRVCGRSCVVVCCCRSMFLLSIVLCFVVT